MASLHLLQQLGVDVVYPERQTCCGQPMGNAGFEDEAAGLARHFEEVFAGYDYVVGPSASCVSFVRDHYGRLLPDHQCHSQQHVYEICEFVHDVIRPTSLNVSFPSETVGFQLSVSIYRFPTICFQPSVFVPGAKGEIKV